LANQLANEVALIFITLGWTLHVTGFFHLSGKSKEYRMSKAVR